jgi:hypothetical protein
MSMFGYPPGHYIQDSASCYLGAVEFCNGTTSRDPVSPSYCCLTSNPGTPLPVNPFSIDTFVFVPPPTPVPTTDPCAVMEPAYQSCLANCLLHTSDVVCPALICMVSCARNSFSDQCFASTSELCGRTIPTGCSVDCTGTGGQNIVVLMII